jgi:hypothetical protein
MVKFLFNLTATKVQFLGCSVKLVNIGQWAVQVKVNGVTYRRPGFVTTRAAAAKLALGITTYAQASGILDCQTWSIVEDAEADQVILERAYKQYRAQGLSPAVSIEYGRNQVEFAKNGW